MVTRASNGAIDLAVVQVVFGGADRRGAAFALRSQRIEGEHAVLRLAELRMALLDYRLCLLVLRLGRLHLSLGEQHLSALLIDGLLPCGDRGPRLVHLIDSDELLGQQRLDAVIVVGRVEQFGVGAVEGGLGIGDICLRFVDRGRGAVDIRRSAVGIRSRRPDGAYLRGDRPALVDDLALQGVQSRTSPSAAHTHRAGDRSQRAAHPV